MQTLSELLKMSTGIDTDAFRENEDSTLVRAQAELMWEVLQDSPDIIRIEDLPEDEKQLYFQIISRAADCYEEVKSADLNAQALLIAEYFDPKKAYALDIEFQETLEGYVPQKGRNTPELAELHALQYFAIGEIFRDFATSRSNRKGAPTPDFYTSLAQGLTQKHHPDFSANIKRWGEYDRNNATWSLN